MTNPIESGIAKIVVGEVKKAADAMLTGAEAQVPAWTDKELAVLENSVGPAFHVPAPILAFLKGENTTIEQTVDPLEVAGLELLKARLDGLAF